MMSYYWSSPHHSPRSLHWLNLNVKLNLLEPGDTVIFLPGEQQLQVDSIKSVTWTWGDVMFNMVPDSDDFLPRNFKQQNFLFLGLGSHVNLDPQSKAELFSLWLWFIRLTSARDFIDWVGATQCCSLLWVSVNSPPDSHALTFLLQSVWKRNDITDQIQHEAVSCCCCTQISTVLLQPAEQSHFPGVESRQRFYVFALSCDTNNRSVGLI